MWTSANANQAVPFSAPWAEKHAQGQVATEGEWRWEYGIHHDMIADAEHIRDRMLLAIYGAFSLAKKRPENANKVLNFCPYLIGKRESRRIRGDWILSEKDVSENKPFEDAIATGSWGLDLHFDGYKEGVDFLTRYTYSHNERFWIPYRSIYSRNVGNLFEAKVSVITHLYYFALIVGQCLNQTAYITRDLFLHKSIFNSTLAEFLAVENIHIFIFALNAVFYFLLTIVINNKVVCNASNPRYKAAITVVSTLTNGHNGFDKGFLKYIICLVFVFDYIIYVRKDFRLVPFK
jgi:hypothetical protein